MKKFLEIIKLYINFFEVVVIVFWEKLVYFDIFCKKGKVIFKEIILIILKEFIYRNYLGFYGNVIDVFYGVRKLKFVGGFKMDE